MASSGTHAVCSCLARQLLPAGTRPVAPYAAAGCGTLTERSPSQLLRHAVTNQAASFPQLTPKGVIVAPYVPVGFWKQPSLQKAPEVRRAATGKHKVWERESRSALACTDPETAQPLGSPAREDTQSTSMGRAAVCRTQRNRSLARTRPPKPSEPTVACMQHTHVSRSERLLAQAVPDLIRHGSMRQPAAAHHQLLLRANQQVGGGHSPLFRCEGIGVHCAAERWPPPVLDVLLVARSKGPHAGDDPERQLCGLDAAGAFWCVPAVRHPSALLLVWCPGGSVSRAPIAHRQQHPDQQRGPESNDRAHSKLEPY